MIRATGTPLYRPGRSTAPPASALINRLKRQTDLSKEFRLEASGHLDAIDEKVRRLRQENADLRYRLHVAEREGARKEAASQPEEKDERRNAELKCMKDLKRSNEVLFKEISEVGDRNRSLTVRNTELYGKLELVRGFNNDLWVELKELNSSLVEVKDQNCRLKELNKELVNSLQFMTAVSLERKPLASPAEDLAVAYPAIPEVSIGFELQQWARAQNNTSSEQQLHEVCNTGLKVPMEISCRRKTPSPGGRSIA